MNRSDLQTLADLRIREAKLLLDNGYWEGAYYLAGYAVECALKACIAKQTREYDFPTLKVVKDSYTHNLEKLVGPAGLRKEFDDELERNRQFAEYWGVVKDWDEEARYQPAIADKSAADLYTAITDNENGVLQWLKKRW